MHSECIVVFLLQKCLGERAQLYDVLTLPVLLNVIVIYTHAHVGPMLRVDTVVQSVSVFVTCYLMYHKFPKRYCEITQ